MPSAELSKAKSHFRGSPSETGVARPARVGTSTDLDAAFKDIEAARLQCRKVETLKIRAQSTARETRSDYTATHSVLQAVVVGMDAKLARAKAGREEARRIEELMAKWDMNDIDEDAEDADAKDAISSGLKP
jgi:hypothetical protein